jgi:DNA-binding MarR family transcriptional regulator
MPRALEEDLERGSGLSLTEYAVLMNLSEAPARELRMTELAQRTALSASRITRVTDSLRQHGWVIKRRCPGDLRGNVATLTDAGLARLQEAYPGHLASVRAHLIDRLTSEETAMLASLIGRLASALDEEAGAEPAPRAATSATAIGGL